MGKKSGALTNFFASNLFFILSGLVHFPYILLPFLLSLAILVENIWNRKRSYKENFVWFWTFNVSSILILVSFLLIFISTKAGPINAAPGLISSTTTHLLTLDNKIFTFFLFLGPFLMLPVLRKKWLLLMLPYFSILFYFGTDVYSFPSIIYLQYGALIVPLLYLGTLDILSEKNNETVQNVSKNIKNSKINQLSHNNNFKTVMAIFVIIVLLGTVYEPYGPLNTDSQTNFGLTNVMNYNATLYDQYLHLVELLPTNSRYVLYQNNMPQVIYRDPLALSTVGVDGYPNNFTYFVSDNQAFIPLTSGNWTHQIEYILADAYSQYFLLTGSGNNSANMYETLDHFLGVGDYGVVGEYDGLILIEKGYLGQPVIYGSENKYFPSSDLFTNNQSYRGDGNISGSNLTNSQLLWYGPYTWLQPGQYEINLDISTTNISQINYFDLLVSYYPNLSKSTQSTLNTFLVKGSDLPSPGKFFNISFTFSTSIFLEHVQFSGMNFHWNGIFSIKNISVYQIQP